MGYEYDQIEDYLAEIGDEIGSTLLPGAHCELCGNTDPDDLDTGHISSLQGYSACCNEGVCNGPEYDGTRRWHLGQILPDNTHDRSGGTIEACCSFRADELAERQGLRALSQVW